MVEKSAIGLTDEPFEMVVERGKVREFARATKSRNASYAGAPGDTPVSPGTFLAAAAFWQPPESNPLVSSGIDLRRVLHGEQEFVFHGPPPTVGQVLAGVSRIDSIREKAGKRGGTMTFCEIVTEFRANDRLVAEARSTIIETSQPAQDPSR